MVLWAVFLASQALKVRFERCSWAFLGFFVAQLAILIGFTAAGARDTLTLEVLISAGTLSQ